MKESQSSQSFALVWRNLCFEAKLSFLDKLWLRFRGHKEIPNVRSILNQVDGHFRCGELTAIMGPSGSGKSTLLKSIFKKNLTGRSGQVNFAGPQWSTTKLNFAFIPQHDTFFDLLTVRESVIFAAKLKASTDTVQEMDPSVWADNRRESLALLKRKPSEEEVDTLLDTLGLTVCADNKIRLCSGGQLKRLSIAQELVTRPDVLILDEPTSGLDSASCEQLIKHLRKLTESTTQPMAVIATIHQPNYKVFSYFHQVYVMSRLGQCIYQGPPTEIVSHLAKYELICPQFYNPADYIIEIAAGEYGFEGLKSLNSGHREQIAFDDQNLFNTHGMQMKPLSESILESKHPLMAHTWILGSRSFLTTVRDPWASGLRLGIHLSFGILVGYLYENSGTIDGCPALVNSVFDPSDLEAIQNSTKTQTDVVIDNCGSIFFSLFVILYTGILSTTLTFPSEMSTLIKERSNGWYNATAYFLGKTIADIPLQIFFPFVYVILTYQIQMQVPTLTRFIGYLIVQILISLISQSQGLLVGALFVRQITAGVYVAPLTTIPWFLFSGYFVKTSSLPKIYFPLMFLSCLKHGFESILIMMYGFDRCAPDIIMKMVNIRLSMVDWFSEMFGVQKNDQNTNNGSNNDTGISTGISSTFVDSVVELVAGDFIRESDGQVKPLALVTFEILDELLWLNLMMLVVTFFIFRLAAFYTIRWQLNRLQ